MRVIVTVVLLLVGLGAVVRAGVEPVTSKQRGHRWVRSHPFTIMGLTRMAPKPFDAEEYRRAGFTALLAWEPGSYGEILPVASAHKLPYHVHLEKWGDAQANSKNANEQTLREALMLLDSEENRAYIRNLTRNPGCVGFLANDEPVYPTYLRYTRHLLKWLREQYPDALAYSNAHPGGHDNDLGYGTLERYLDEFAAIVEPDVLMTDVYPLGDPDGTSEDYFRLLSAIRRTALEHDMPYWMFIQSFETRGNWTRRLPSESDLRFQLWTPLTYGYTGIAYYTYDIAHDRGLLETDGTPNRLYHAAAKANAEVANVGKTLRFLTSTDVRYVPGRHRQGGKTVPNTLPRDTKAWTIDAGGDRSILDVAVDPDDAGESDPALLDLRQNKDGFIGFFRDDHGGRYFMLTNLWHNAGASAPDRALSFRIRFAPKVKRLYRLNRTSGRIELVKLTDGKLSVRLPGGTGELFGYAPGLFPGTKQ